MLNTKVRGGQGNYSSTINHSPWCKSLWGSGAKKQAEKACAVLYIIQKSSCYSNLESQDSLKKKNTGAKQDPRNSILVENHSLLLGK